jgi:hypothetical protein
LHRFVEKNNIPAEDFDRSTLLKKLIEDGNKQIVVSDAKGSIHFHSSFRNADILDNVLEKLRGTKYEAYLQKEKGLVLDIYERMFDHQSFTGRSGTFYKYEGLGCIYWHMVSKLLLAVGEVISRAEMKNKNDAILQRLIMHYHDIREGLGAHKSPAEYGAFPSDPYSHTPGHAGVQQPGMSGQVKEDIVSRFIELGVVIDKGLLSFKPILLRKSEFIRIPKTFQYYSLDGIKKEIKLEKGTLAFTLCQVPIIYHLSRESKLHVHMNNGSIDEIPGLCLSQTLSTSVFNRSNEVVRMDVFISLHQHSKHHN